MERLVLVLAVAAIVTASGCSAQSAPGDASPTVGATSTAVEATVTAAAPSETLQRAVADEVRGTLGAGSGSGTSPGDPAMLEVSVFAERDALDDDHVAAAEREVTRLAAAEGFDARFVYGASDGS